mgnify:FL=1|jgi:c-di-GMP-binding flagellar brake protein YcgR
MTIILVFHIISIKGGYKNLVEEKRRYIRGTEQKEEKRKHIRVNIEHDPLEVQIMGDAFLDVLETKDISASGVGVIVPHEFRGLNINKEVDLILTLLNETPFKAKGIIRHKGEYDSNSEKGHFSVKFTNISYKNKKMIDRFVQNRLDSRN